jgi:hypothetical protein
MFIVFRGLICMHYNLILLQIAITKSKKFKIFQCTRDCMLLLDVTECSKYFIFMKFYKLYDKNGIYLYNATDNFTLSNISLRL